MIFNNFVATEFKTVVVCIIRTYCTCIKTIEDKVLDVFVLSRVCLYHVSHPFLKKVCRARIRKDCAEKSKFDHVQTLATNQLVAIDENVIEYSYCPVLAMGTASCKCVCRRIGRLSFFITSKRHTPYNFELPCKARVVEVATQTLSRAILLVVSDDGSSYNVDQKCFRITFSHACSMFHYCCHNQEIRSKTNENRYQQWLT